MNETILFYFIWLLYDRKSMVNTTRSKGKEHENRASDEGEKDQQSNKRNVT